MSFQPCTCTPEHHPLLSASAHHQTQSSAHLVAISLSTYIYRLAISHSSWIVYVAFILFCLYLFWAFACHSPLNSFLVAEYKHVFWPTPQGQLTYLASQPMHVYPLILIQYYDKVNPNQIFWCSHRVRPTFNSYIKTITKSAYYQHNIL